MSKSPPTIDLLVRWLEYLLEERDVVVVFSHHMNTHVPEWVNRTYDRMHTAETYARKWRRLRSDEGYRLHQAGLTVTEVPDTFNPKTNEKAWQIQRHSSATPSERANPKQAKTTGG